MKNKAFFLLLSAAFMVLVFNAGSVVAKVIYVDGGAAGTNDGISWTDACSDLQDAIDSAASGDELWVAAGTYAPSVEHGGSGDSYRSFQMKNGVAIYGGFAGDETTRDQRNRDANQTILSGDLNGDDAPGFANRNDNCYHVFYHPEGTGLNGTAVLDGFTVSGGYSGSRGGGMHNVSSSPTVANCTFTDNYAHYGGGIYNISSSPVVTDCTFSDNAVLWNGGGMFNASSSPTLTGCTFSGNRSTGNSFGGGMLNRLSSPVLKNCRFSDNHAEYGGGIANRFESSRPVMINCTFLINSAYLGGGIYNYEASPELRNCIFSDNSAHRGGGIANTSELSRPVITNCTFSGNSATHRGCGLFNDSLSAAVVTNCIFWDDAADEVFNDNSNCYITYSNVRGGTGQPWFGTGCIDTDPEFADTSGSDPAGWDLNLKYGSRCVDAGNNSAVPPGLTTDIQGRPRFIDEPYTADTGNGSSPVVDMGAYELLPSPDDEDADSDGLSNRAELQNNTDPYDPDSDGDSFHDGAEVVHDSDPGDSGSTPETPAVIYVKADASGADTGRSWADAFTLLQSALFCAVITGDEIRVAAGTYTPTAEYGGSGDRYRSFRMKNGVAIYGGFAGGETTRDQRNLDANKTILSGDLNGDDLPGFINRNDNCYHVFYHLNGTGLNGTAVLDGFTVSGGYCASGGGGMYNASSSPAVANCTFTDNYAYYGGGVYNSSSSPVMTNCMFSGNTVLQNGGGVLNTSSSPVLSNCIFRNNHAQRGGGAANRSELSKPVMTNCTFAGNAATDAGGGMYSETSSAAEVANCIFWGDAPDAFYNENATPVVTYSNVQGGTGRPWFGTGCIDTDPEFSDTSGSDPAGWDLKLKYGSRCVDAGNNSAVPQGLTTDIQGRPRFTDEPYTADTGNGSSPVVDMGALELQPQDVEYDTDGDGMRDGWEINHFGSIDVSNGLDDPDGDGLADLEEFQNTTDPNSADSDGDGFSDGYEAVYGFIPVDPVSRPSVASPVFYVKAGASGDSNGLFWADAFTDLQTALTFAVPGNEIRVAAGTYQPSVEHGGTGERFRSFRMKNGVSVYGGFAGNEDPAACNINSRDFALNESILSGDIGTYGDSADNCYHVFYHADGTGLDETAVLDGFTITGGNADGDDEHGNGGGMCNNGSSPEIVNCRFLFNLARSGGGMDNCNNSSPTMVNCIFAENKAAVHGGGINNSGSSPSLINCTFSLNESVLGGGMHNAASSAPEAVNCIFWGDFLPEIFNADPGSSITVSYSNVQAGTGQDWFGSGCIDALPGFADDSGGDFHLLSVSPCIDAGSPYTGDAEAGDVDIGGLPRVIGGCIDMGAYEYCEIPIPVLSGHSLTDSALVLEIKPFPVEQGGVVHSRSQWRVYDSPCDGCCCDGASVILDNYTYQNHAGLEVPLVIFNEIEKDYYWQVRFEGGFSSNTSAKKWSEWTCPGSFSLKVEHDVDKKDFETDLDKDGRPDIEQDDILVRKTSDGNAEIGLKITGGYNFHAIQAFKPESFDDETDSRYLPFGLVTFRIEIPEGNAGEIEVEIYFAIPMPDESRLYCYDAEKGILDVMEDAGFNEDRTCIRVKLKDGGRGDLDGTANNTIVHKSGIGMKTDAQSHDGKSTNRDAAPDSGVDVGGHGCFIDVAGGCRKADNT